MYTKEIFNKINKLLIDGECLEAAKLLQPYINSNDKEAQELIRFLPSFVSKKAGSLEEQDKIIEAFELFDAIIDLGFESINYNKQEHYEEIQMRLNELRSNDEIEKWIDLVSQLTKVGFAQSMYELGNFYISPISPINDFQKGFKYLSDAAKKGHDEANLLLGKLYFEGLGCEKNILKGIECFSESAKANNPEAQYYLALCYLNGIAVEQNYEKAIEYLKPSSESNYSNSLYCLAICYQTGLGLDKDIDKAIECYNKIISNNWITAIEHPNKFVTIDDVKYELGCLLAQKQQYSSAVKIWNEIKNGKPEVLYNLGVAYLFGQGVDKDESKAFNYFKEAANSGLPEALLNLANCYHFGIGTSKDSDLAIKYWTEAASHNNHLAKKIISDIKNGKAESIKQDDALQHFDLKSKVSFKVEENDFSFGDLQNIK